MPTMADAGSKSPRKPGGYEDAPRFPQETDGASPSCALHLKIDHSPLMRQSNRSSATVHLKNLSGEKSADARSDIHDSGDAELAGDNGAV